jgi:hypothetical protein
MRGGVGNQLFQLCAGLYFSKMNKKEIALDFSEISMADHGGFKIIEASFFELTQVEHNGIEPRSLLDRSKVRYVQEKFLKSTNNYFRGFIVQESEFGEDTRIDSWRQAIKIKGYFQTTKYVDHLFKEKFLTLQDFRTTKFNPKAQKIAEYLEQKSPIVLHVRAGDYKNHLNSIGILGPSYYSHAIKKFENYAGREVFLVTDDLEHANQILDKAGIQVTYMPETELLHPLELINAISHAKDFLIPNSSFSWWAAKLSNKSGTVVCPTEWFKGFDTPKGIKPSNWVEAKSYFME